MTARWLGPVLALALIAPALADAADFGKLQKRLEPHYRAYRPDGTGPFPAVMMVSGCSGFTPSVAPTSYTAVAERLKGEGFLVIFVDYLAARGLSRCFEQGRYRVDFDDIAQDVLASAAYLRVRPDVKAADITVIGWSWGGGGVLEALRAVGEPVPFRAAVAFYPACEGVRPWKAAIPVLMLLGALDDVAPARTCQSLARKLPATSPVEVRVYEEAHHGFDASELSGVVRHPAGTMGYNEVAARAAWGEVEKILGR